MAGVFVYQGTDQKLLADQGEVLFHREHLGFRMQVWDWGHLHGARGYSEGGILCGLEFLDGGLGGISEPLISCSP